MPGTLGSSGMEARWASSDLLNELSEQLDIFLRRTGNELNSLGPFTPMLPNLMVWMRPGAADLMVGTTQYLPLRLF